MVMALHFVNNGIAPTTLLEQAAVKITNYGLWGVDLFFVLSGFLITGILVESKNAPGYFRNFFVRRALRIFPLYYGVLLVLLLVASSTALQRLDPELLSLRTLSPWLWPYLTNVYLGPHTDFSIPYVSHFWSLAIEEHFYLVWPFLIWCLPHRSAMRACVILGSAALLLRVGFATFAPDQLYATVLTPCRIDSLCAGAWFALAARDRFPLPTGRALSVAQASGAVIVLLSAWNFMRDGGEMVVLPLRTTALAVFFGALIYAASYDASRIHLRGALRLGWLRHLGKYSYGLYVFHGIVAYGMERFDVPAYFEGLSSIPTLNALVQITIAVGTSYVLALLSFHLFETPFLSLKRFFEYRARPALRHGDPDLVTVQAETLGGALLRAGEPVQ
jgi:peptidoglycan/LPS O-acetylase OafA/YrhL